MVASLATQSSFDHCAISRFRFKQSESSVKGLKPYQYTAMPLCHQRPSGSDHQPAQRPPHRQKLSPVRPARKLTGIGSRSHTPQRAKSFASRGPVNHSQATTKTRLPPFLSQRGNERELTVRVTHACARIPMPCSMKKAHGPEHGWVLPLTGSKEV